MARPTTLEGHRKKWEHARRSRNPRIRKERKADSERLLHQSSNPDPLIRCSSCKHCSPPWMPYSRRLVCNLFNTYVGFTFWCNNHEFREPDAEP